VEQTVARWIAEAGRVTVLTGAGISTDSGIGDFRGPQGLWTRNPGTERMFHLRDYLADPELRVRAWRQRRDHPAWSARPNAGHVALVDLDRAGRLRAVVTQNIDGLHQRAGLPPERVIEIHGTLHWAACLGCGLRTPMREVLDRVDAGEADPPCRACGGIQRSATVAFGQALDPAVLSAAVAAAADCDLFLAVGSTLLVQPAAGLCSVAQQAGAQLVVLNGEPTGYDDVADAVLRGSISDVLPRLVAAASAA
jgi:NAD-dependent deacetylase